MFSIMALRAVFSGFGLSFYLLLGSGNIPGVCTQLQGSEEGAVAHCEDGILGPLRRRHANGSTKERQGIGEAPRIAVKEPKGSYYNTGRFVFTIYSYHENNSLNS